MVLGAETHILIAWSEKRSLWICVGRTIGDALRTSYPHVEIRRMSVMRWWQLSISNRVTCMSQWRFHPALENCRARSPHVVDRLLSLGCHRSASTANESNRLYIYRHALDPEYNN
jgi:hypothetical protein